MVHRGTVGDKVTRWSHDMWASLVDTLATLCPCGLQSDQILTWEDVTRFPSDHCQPGLAHSLNDRVSGGIDWYYFGITKDH